MEIVPAHLEYSTVCPPDSPLIREAARLVVGKYIEKGYMKAGDSVERRRQLEIEMTDSLNGYRVVVSLVNGRVTSTMSVMIKDELPMDAVFHKELEPLRRQGLKVVEIGKYAGDVSFTTHLEVMACAYLAAVRAGADIIGATINPNKHLDFHSKFLRFGLLANGEVRPHPLFENNPAVGLYAPVDCIRARRGFMRALRAQQASAA